MVTPPVALLNLDDLDYSGRDRHGGGEPRVYDFILARALGYVHARNIRRLIKASRDELETHGELVEKRDRSGGTGDLLPPGANARAGRPGMAFYLNEAQALVICALTRTAAAAKLRGEIIRVYMLWRAREIRAFPAHYYGNLVPAERMALRSLLANADVVMAPTYLPLAIPGESGHKPPYISADGHIPYVLAPVTESLLETLESFELEEDGDDSDYEPSIGGIEGDDREGDDCDSEDNGDREPSLGAPERDESEPQWSGCGQCQDLEEDGIGNGRMLGMDRLRAIQRKTPRHDLSRAARQAARDIRQLVNRSKPERGNLVLLS